MRLFRWVGTVIRHVFHIPVQEAVSPQLPPAAIPVEIIPFPKPGPFTRIVRTVRKATSTHERSGHWRSKRAQHLRSQPRCAACGCKDNLTVHHIIPFHIEPELELEDTNLITLCENSGNCHLMIGHLKDWKAYNPHVRQMAASMLQLVKNRPYT